MNSIQPLLELGRLRMIINQRKGQLNLMNIAKEATNHEHSKGTFSHKADVIKEEIKIYEGGYKQLANKHNHKLN